MSAQITTTAIPMECAVGMVIDVWQCQEPISTPQQCQYAPGGANRLPWWWESGGVVAVEVEGQTMEWRAGEHGWS